jgi:hypothetical protein
MACPECEATRKQFLEMRRAVLSFARTLNQFEEVRLARVDAGRPAGAPLASELRALIEKDAGLVLERLICREVRD